MTVHRRSLLLPAAIVLFLPACISISAGPKPLTPAEVAARITAEGAARATERVHTTGSDFAIYPSRPGEVLPTHPVPKDITTVQKPKQPSVPSGPVVPPSPVAPAGGPGSTDPSNPGVFPLAAMRSLPHEPPLLAAVRAHLDGKPERAFESIASLDRNNQEVILALLPVLTRGATANLAGDPLGAAILVDQLRVAASRLEPFAALRVEAAVFCDEINGFARYKPSPINRPFAPKELATLYLEVRNLVSQPHAGPKGETYLTMAHVRAVVKDAYGNSVDLPHPKEYRRKVKVVEYDDNRYTRAPIQEFHMIFVFPVPTNPGVYTVQLELTDAAGRRSVKTPPVEFRVAGP
jgi:hypothetical protein